MPRVIEGARGVKGSFYVVPFEVANNLIASDDRNPQLRVRYQDRDDKDQIFSLGVDMVDMDKAYGTLQAPSGGLITRSMLDGADLESEGGEQKLRTIVGGSLVTEPMLAYVSGSYIQSFTAMPGRHRGQFSSLFLLRPATPRRCGISIRNEEGFESFWTMPWGPDAEGKGAAVITTVGATSAEDQIEVFKSKAVWEALITLGFDWDLFMEKLKTVEQLYTNVGLDGEEPGLFADHENLTPELSAFLKDPRVWFPDYEGSGPNTVRWEVVDDPKYGIGAKRGDYSKVLLTEVEVDDAEFTRELSLWHTRWDQLTQKLSGDQNARFMQAGKLTDLGRNVAKKVMVPVVAQYPDVVKGKKADGSPSIKFPPTPETWGLNGLVCMTLLAGRLHDEETVMETVDDPEALLAWTNLSVEELQMDLNFVDGEEEEL
jgi:hypothetical protein